MLMENRSWTRPTVTKQVSITVPALDLNGVDNALEVPAPTTIGDEITVEFWMNRAAVTSGIYEIIYDGYHSYSTATNGLIIYIQNGNLIFAGTNDAGANWVYNSVTASTVCDGTWHHVAMTADNIGNWKYYIDGTLVNTKTGPVGGTSFATTSVGRIGARNGASPILYQYNGEIREFALWQVPRTASEIGQSYGNQKVPSGTGLMHHIPMNEGSGNTVTDAKTSQAVPLMTAVNLSWGSTTITMNIEVDQSYRFGFQGKEQDDDVKGAGNSIAFEARIYDSRLGRFLSIDPLFASFPGHSAYSFANNNPIQLIDFMGMSPDNPNDELGTDNIQLATSGGLSNHLVDVESDLNSTLTESPTNRNVWKTSAYLQETTSHTFRWEQEDVGHVVGEDVIRSYKRLQKQIAYDDGTVGFEITETTHFATIDRFGVASDIRMSYSQNINGEIFETSHDNVPLTSSPGDFQTLFNAAMEFKNNPRTYQKSFIQHVADNNASLNKDIRGVTSFASGVATAISYLPGGKGPAKIIGAMTYMTNLGLEAFNSEDPTKLSVNLHRYSSYKNDILVPTDN